MDMEATFTEIFEKNLWGSGECVSGPGSTYAYTANLRRNLPELVRNLSIKSIFDAPCGDLNWMKHLFDDLEVEYIGGDIVLPLIQSHQASYARENIGFIHIDLTREKFPQMDLMICRDCLLHLSYGDTLLLLQNFIDANIKYLLLPTHKKSNNFRNTDIRTGGARLVDLFSPPYNFPAAPVLRFDDWVPPYQEREMCLWTRDQVIAARDSLANWLNRKSDRRPTASNGLKHLAQSLAAEGRAGDALLILEHLAETGIADAQALRTLAKLLGAQGRTLEALGAVSKLKSAANDPADIVQDLQEQIAPAIERFNNHLAAGEVAEAERYAAALAALVPGNIAILNAAVSCNRALDRNAEAAKYEAALRSVEKKAPGLIAEEGNSENVDMRVAKALSDTSEHPLLRLRNLHDAMSAILIRPLDGQSPIHIEKLLSAARRLEVSVPPGSEWAAWEKHYRVMVEAAAIGSVYAETPAAAPKSPAEFATSLGAESSWTGLREQAARMGAKCIFFAAADRHYVDLYARWYVKSILKHCDVPCLIVVHVIGGAGDLRAIAEAVNIRDDRLFFAGDCFDAAAVTTACYDSPPKGRIAKPVAHFQSMRFLRLGGLLSELQRPVFVSDIDLLLQYGVADLLERCAGEDVVLNENTASLHAGSRITANLALVNPTANAGIFLRYLRAYLDDALAKPEVSRWIDQFALMLARHHLSIKGNSPRIGYFDTGKDINNVMFPSYQKNPFRFLSLYHGFDLSSLEDTAEAEKEPAPGTPRGKRLAA